jgi:hypothetical protein
MPDIKGEQVTATPTEARQGERGPSVRNVLVTSVVLALAAMVAIWLLFFKT